MPSKRGPEALRLILNDFEANSNGKPFVDYYKEKGEKYFVQCKQWKAYKVGVKIVRELLGVMVGGGATGGFVVTSGQFTKDAHRFAQENNVAL